jgi:hypothetical protein
MNVIELVTIVIDVVLLECSANLAVCVPFTIGTIAFQSTKFPILLYIVALVLQFTLYNQYWLLCVQSFLITTTSNTGRSLALFGGTYVTNDALTAVKIA